MANDYTRQQVNALIENEYQDELDENGPDYVSNYEAYGRIKVETDIFLEKANRIHKQVKELQIAMRNGNEAEIAKAAKHLQATCYYSTLGTIMTAMLAKKVQMSLGQGE